MPSMVAHSTSSYAAGPMALRKGQKDTKKDAEGKEVHHPT